MRKLKIILSVVLFNLILAGGSFGADSIADAFREGTVKGEFRSYFFQRDYRDGSTDWEDATMGGLFYYRTAPFQGVSGGVAFYTSQDFNSDDGKAVYGLLSRSDNGDHESYTALGEFYLQGQWFNTLIRFGGQEINTPWLNNHDIRMTPNSYKALKVVNKSIPHLTVSGYYVTEFKPRAETDFDSIAKSIPGVNEDEDLAILGLSWEAPKELGAGLWDRLVVEGWDYYLDDVLNNVYLRLRYGKAINGFSYLLEPRYFRQSDSGDSLAGDLSTYMAGAGLHIKGCNASLSLLYGQIGDDALVVPWGDHKMIINQVRNLSRAEEKAYGVKLGYDFTSLGVKGLSAYVFYGDYNTPDSGKNVSPDLDETDFSVEYKFSGQLEGLSLRLRYAIIDADKKLAGEDINDIRFYLKYRFGSGGGKS